MVILAGNIGHRLGELLAEILVARARVGKLLHRIYSRILKCLVRHRRPRKTDDGKSARKAVLRSKSIKRGDQLSARKIARSPKDYDSAWVRRHDRWIIGGLAGFGTV